MRIWILVLLFVVGARALAEDGPSLEQKLAALNVTGLERIHIAELVTVRNAAGDGTDKAESHPGTTLGPGQAITELRWITAPTSYLATVTRSCFDPGMRIILSGTARTVTLDVCLDCRKVLVKAAGQEEFGMDLSDLGVALYKSIYLDFVIQTRKQRLIRE